MLEVNKMEIRVLKYFLAIAREGSLTGAGNLLHVTQPTLSRQIKDLEEELGKKLFVRSNYSVKLTDEGMLLRKRAEDIIDMVEKTEAEFKAMNDIVGGEIYIGAGESEGMKCLVEIAGALQMDYPNIRYHLYSGNSEQIAERLDRGLIDFGVFMQAVDSSKYNSTIMPTQNTWGVIMRRDSPLASKRDICVEDLLLVPLICSRQAIKSEFSKWFGEKLEKMNIIATYDLLYNASLMVKEGLGYVIGFDKIIETNDESELCFRPLYPALASNMYVVWKKYQVFSSAADLFLKRLQSEFATIGE